MNLSKLLMRTEKSLLWIVFVPQNASESRARKRSNL